MVQIVRKKKGRPSKTDLAARAVSRTPATAAMNPESDKRIHSRGSGGGGGGGGGERIRDWGKMHLLNAVLILRMATRGEIGPLESHIVQFGSIWFFIYAGICMFMVIFAGIMSGLTLGLMSLSLVDLEILQRSGDPQEKKQAAAIYPASSSKAAPASGYLASVQCLCYGGLRLYWGIMRHYSGELS